VAIRHFHRGIAGLCLIGGLLAFEMSPASAQQAPAAPAPAQPGVAAQPPAAPLPPLTPSHLAIAHEVLVASGIAKSFDPIIGNVASQLLQLYTNKRPSNARDYAEILVSMKPELDAKKNEIVAKATEVYARKLDEPTLKAVLVFLKTPAGANYVAALPDILNGVADVTDTWTKEVATMMGTRVVEEMKKRGVEMGR